MIWGVAASNLSCHGSLILNKIRSQQDKSRVDVWRGVTRVLCDRRILIKLKGEFYRTVIRLPMLHGTEYQDVKKKHINKLSVAEIRMLRQISGNTY